MSIALSVVVAPSRRLRCLLAGFGTSLFAAACAVGLAAPARFAGAPCVAAALLFAAACVLRAALRAATVHRIDISGPGQLRLTVQQGVRQDERAGLPARLSAGSTLWPRMLLLCLEVGHEAGIAGASGCAHGWLRRCRRALRACAGPSVAVLPDSLPPEALRALAVALGAGVQTSGGSAAEHKIL